MPESTDRYVEKVLEGYGSTDTGPLRDLLKLLEEGFSFPMQEGFARQKAKRKMMRIAQKMRVAQKIRVAQKMRLAQKQPKDFPQNAIDASAPFFTTHR